MVFQNNGVTYTLRNEDIDYIESLGRKLIIHSKNEEIETYGKISDIANELDDSFYQIHRSYIVNMSKIINYSKNEVTLQNEDKIPLSKYRYEDFAKEYSSYLERSR